MCGKCGKRCERLTEYYDQFMNRVVFVAHCHGERERVVLEVELFDCRSFDISTGTAFVQDKLLVSP
jgi:hypothetical protein